MKRMLVTLLAFAITPFGCSSEPPTDHIYRVPESLDDGIGVGSLFDVELDADLIGTAVGEIAAGAYGEVHSFLIHKDGRLVLEEYFPGHDYSWDAPGFHGALVAWETETPHNVHSVGKSLTSACVGIAIERGFIGSVNDSIFDYLPDHQHLKGDGKNRITIEHLLTMTSGLEWDEWGTSYSSAENDVIALWTSCNDPVACILGKPLVSEPGARFTYSGGNIILLGEIIRNAGGKDIETFAREYLLEPLGIQSGNWPRIGTSDVIYPNDQAMTPRDMLKIGIMYLDQGLWLGERIVPQSWVDRSATPYGGPDSTWFNSFMRSRPPGDSTWGRRGYAYTWWTHEFSDSGESYPGYWAYGWGGQRIFVVPSERTVVVFTGGNYSSADATARLVSRYVIPAFD